MNNTIHTLWIGNELSAMELLTLSSFNACGYPIILWSYDPISNVPRFVQQKEANEIISRDAVFTYDRPNKFGHGKGSIGGFSDIFRYKLLHVHGGIWADMDITCLQPFEKDMPYFFRAHHQTGVVGNLLKAPQGSPVMLWCYEETVRRVDQANTDWLLPVKILREGVKRFGLQAYVADVTNDDSFPIVAGFIKKNKYDYHKWKALHWMNEEWRRLMLDKNIAIKNSSYQLLLEKYRIPHRVATDSEASSIRWKTSAVHYAWLNLKARTHWYYRKLFQNF